ncbi:MAG: hypothetical protein J7604_22695 [Sporocytophaga sp.]|uniref:hypothetical protein n=1 Tax=Sporocytophaga sp. TaxID=2231183 RepID=UPI001B299910|nr:hypothetical protein [Sporocytophaga sp.]MBO9703041.1 hypothetical protein [Sporocytophaga sp.]
MRLLSLNLLILIILNTHLCQAFNLIEKDYSINIPEGWNAIAKDKLDDLRSGHKIELTNSIRGYALNDSLGVKFLISF